MDPVLFKIGSFPLQWYGLMYIAAFVTVYLLATYRSKKDIEYGYTKEFHKDLLTTTFLGLLIGARLGYVVFYNLPYYLQHPLEIIIPVNLQTGQFTGISGMSFHGGLIGVLVAIKLYARKRNTQFFAITDFYAPIVPLGYTFGRLGNFINGELYGRVTDSAVGMYFPSDSTGQLRHPSQLYEAFTEGVLCFLVLWYLKDIAKKYKWGQGAMSGLYMIGYGIARFSVEFFRQPDEQFKGEGEELGFVFLDFSMGQVLCFVMIVVGLLMITRARRLQQSVK